MKKYLTVSAGIFAGAALMFAAAPAMARVDVGVNLGVPAPVYVQPAPVYVEPGPVYVQPRPYYYDRYHHRHYHHRHHDHH